MVRCRDLRPVRTYPWTAAAISSWSIRPAPQGRVYVGRLPTDSNNKHRAWAQGAATPRRIAFEIPSCLDCRPSPTDRKIVVSPLPGRGNFAACLKIWLREHERRCHTPADVAGPSRRQYRTSVGCGLPREERGSGHDLARLTVSRLRRLQKATTGFLNLVPDRCLVDSFRSS